jgi:photosystem II stability/assembly factor-like uncharacterized protein
MRNAEARRAFIFLLASLPTWCFGAMAAHAQSGGPGLDVPFRNVGPPQTGGRVTALAGLPGNYNVYYVGTAGGGLWKTVNGGDSWDPIFEHGPSGSIGAIELSPANPQVIWLGTGETDLRNGAIDGDGLFRSMDGGKSWQEMGFANTGQIGAISVDPRDPNVVVVGVLGHISGPNQQRGVFRSTDGGKTWSKVLYVDATTGCIQIVRVPGSPKTLFAAMFHIIRYPWLTIEAGSGSGIYRSTDGGATWHKLTRGLPQGPLGRIALAVAPSNPKRIYAMIYAEHGRLWMSNDEGDSWSFVSDNHALSARPFYFSAIAVSPQDENKLYFGALDFLESDDGGKTVHPIDEGVHGDDHAIWIDPDNGDHILNGNDGGAFETSDGGRHWRAFKNMPIGQYYAVSATATRNGTPYIICGGLQDNSGWCGPSSDLDREDLDMLAWKAVVGGDGNYVVPAPSDPSIIYTTAATVSAGAFYRYDTRTGVAVFHRPSWWVVNETGPENIKYRWALPTPIAVSSTDPNTVYVAANVVFKSTTGGNQWQVISPDLTRNDKDKQRETGKAPIAVEYTTVPDTIMGLSIAPTDPNVIWVGTDDGLVWVTRDGGGHWSNVRPKIPGVPYWARVYEVGVSPFDAGSAYIAMDASRVDDRRIYVYKTHDYGRSWQRITGGLPADVPGHVVREDPDRKGLLILGTDTSLYCSHDDGASWSLLSKQFPSTPVWDLRFVKGEHALVVATHGRSLFTFDNLRPLEEAGAASGRAFYAFSPAPGTLFHQQRLGLPDLPYYSVPNVPPGVRIAYYVRQPVQAGMQHRVRIVIRNGRGETVAERYDAAHPGLNEFAWNLRYDGPTGLDFERPAYTPARRRIPYGPLVLPGRYSIELSYGDTKQTLQAVVRPDPRLHVPEGQMRDYSRYALELRSEVSALDRMLNQIVVMRQRIARLEAAGRHDEADREARNLDAQLKGIEDQVFDPQIQHDAGEDMLHALFRTYGKLTRLFYVVSFSYYEVPSPAMVAAMKSVRQELDSALDRYNHFVTTAMPRLNSALRSAGIEPVEGVSEIRIGARAHI